MSCNCRWTEGVLALIILIVTIWEFSASMWITIVAAAILLLHSLFHHRCGCAMCSGEMKSMPAKKATRRKRR